MKKLLYLPVSLMMAAGSVAAQEKPFTLSGEIKGKTDAYIYLTYKNGSTDSSLIQNGKFSFAGEVDSPAQAMVMMDRNARFFDKYAQLYIAPANMRLSLDYNNFTDGAVLKGSPVQAEADVLAKMRAPAMAKLKPLQKAYDKANNVYIDARKANKDEATLETLKDEATKAKDAMDPYIEEMNEAETAFMDKYPASYVTASAMRYRVSGMKLQEAEQRYNKLPDGIKASALGKEIKKDVDNLRLGSPGANAYVFASKELRGNPLSLADYKGKYVLLDFWASWCVPCRKGNPHLLSLYSKYKDKGFEIIGISDDDRNLEAWQKAVEKDNIGVWKHVLRGFKWTADMRPDRTDDISDRYGIHTLPTKVLIDPNGIIIGRYGGGGENDEAMDKKLSEVFGG